MMQQGTVAAAVPKGMSMAAATCRPLTATLELLLASYLPNNHSPSAAAVKLIRPAAYASRQAQLNLPALSDRQQSSSADHWQRSCSAE